MNLIIHDFAYRKPVTSGILSNSVNATHNNGKVPTRSINQVSNERILSSPVMPMYDKVKAISIPDRHKITSNVHANLIIQDEVLFLSNIFINSPVI